MNILFVAAGPIEWGSSRMRAYWVVEEMENAHCIQNGENVGIPAGYDVYVWQKSVNTNALEGIDGRHYWDVCDPAWWWQPNECRVIADRMTAVVASSQALADDFNEWYGQDKAICIPDRLKLSHFHTQRQHTAVSPVRFIWFGVSVNRIALYAALANLERLVANGYKIELTIFDDRPDVPFKISNKFPIYNMQWSLDKEVEVLSNHDIALLPPYPGAWGRVKSDNKVQTAVACGLPANDGQGYEGLCFLMEWHFRKMDVMYSGCRIKKTYGDVKNSAVEWEALLSS